MIVVANAGPLIALARIGQLGLLRALYGRLHIPQAVWREVVELGQGKIGASEVGLADWIKVVPVQDKMAVRILRGRLDPGESQSIVLALEIGADLLLMDEARGRRVAEMQGLHITGTIGTLLVAKRRGMLTEVTSLLDELQVAGFRMSRALYRAACTLAGEL